MWPFTPAWNSKKHHKAVTKIISQHRLALVASNAFSEWAKLEAVKKLDCLEVLAEIEAQSVSASVRLEAQGRIKEIVGALDAESALVALAKGHAYPSVRKEAIRHITDTLVLSDIATGR